MIPDPVILGPCTLYHGDCLEILPRLTGVDAVVTDPPYGIDFDYGKAHDDDPDKYAEWMRTLLESLKPIVNGNPVFMWQAMLNAPIWHRWFPPNFRIFAACKGFVQFRPTPIQFSWDPVIFWGKCKGEPNVYRKDWNVQSLAPFGLNRTKIEHPCPRPLEQVESVLCAGTCERDVVLDPCMGSGTTGIACIRTGRKFIGVEIDEGYFKIAVDRIRRELQQQTFDLK